MKISVNGKELNCDANDTPRDVINVLQIKDSCALDLNGYVLPQDQYDTYNLKEGDKIELIEFVGGG